MPLFQHQQQQLAEKDDTGEGVVEAPESSGETFLLCIGRYTDPWSVRYPAPIPILTPTSRVRIVVSVVQIPRHEQCTFHVPTLTLSPVRRPLTPYLSPGRTWHPSTQPSIPIHPSHLRLAFAFVFFQRSSGQSRTIQPRRYLVLNRLRQKRRNGHYVSYRDTGGIIPRGPYRQNNNTDLLGDRYRTRLSADHLPSTADR